MATLAHPDEPRRPNIASADIQLPAVTSYEQVDNEILAILKPTKAWFGALGIALACLALGAFSWIYQIHEAAPRPRQVSASSNAPNQALVGWRMERISRSTCS